MDHVEIILVFQEEISQEEEDLEINLEEEILVLEILIDLEEQQIIEDYIFGIYIHSLEDKNYILYLDNVED
jgi:hypothetical protein